MSMGCAAGCGRCCNPVKLNVPPEVLEAWRDHVPHMRPAEAANTSWALDHFTFVEVDPATGMFAYACDSYDEGDAKCITHDARPPMCRQWPTEAPGLAGAYMPDACSYQWDAPVKARGPVVGRLLPLTPV